MANFDGDEFRTQYIQCIHDLVVEQPFKIPFVATIVRVANAENAEVGKAVVDHMAEALQRYLHVGAFNNVKLVMRFMTCLGDLLGEQGVGPILDALVEKLPAYQGDGDEVRLWVSARVMKLADGFRDCC